MLYISSAIRLRGALNYAQGLLCIFLGAGGRGGASVVWGDGRQNSATLLLRPGILNSQLSSLIIKKTN